ncbi:MAG: trypsin-like serine protease [Acidimicrobiia bacterium]|nr:trypsin-like serine protease [Acidimicrobiia bacterium]
MELGKIVRPRVLIGLAATAVMVVVVVAQTGAVSADRARTRFQPAAIVSGRATSTKPVTFEQMRSARPMRVPSPAAGASDGAPGANGPAGTIAGALPDGGHASTLAAPSTGRAVNTMAGGFAYPTPFDRYPVTSRSTYPQSTVGKVFFTQQGGTYVCSAAVISERAVWTAGHCVSDGAGHYDTAMTFVPQYQNGVRPKGTFTCTKFTTFAQWHTGLNFRFDQAVVTCGVNANGQTLRAAVGRLGFAYNQAQPKHYNAFGYPATAPFNGETMQQCASSFGHNDTRIGGTGATPFAIGCDMTGGASGGPWILKYAPGSTGAAVNLLNGHNDYKYLPKEPLEMYSPYLDTNSHNLVCNATELC